MGALRYEKFKSQVFDRTKVTLKSCFFKLLLKKTPVTFMKDPLLLIKCTLYCGIIYYLGGGGLVSKLFGGDFFSLIANIIIL